MNLTRESATRTEAETILSDNLQEYTGLIQEIDYLMINRQDRNYVDRLFKLNTNLTIFEQRISSGHLPSQYQDLIELIKEKLNDIMSKFREEAA